MFGNKTEPGIISMAVQRCFDLAAQNSAREFSFRVSFLEVYNEQVKDLLSSGEAQEIKIQSHPTLGTVVTGNKEIAVKTCEEIGDLIERGETARSIASTDMNEQSSRAHTLFRLMVEAKFEFGKCGRVALQFEGGHGPQIRHAACQASYHCRWTRKTSRAQGQHAQEDTRQKTSFARFGYCPGSSREST
jgi:hypothetical protein